MSKERVYIADSGVDPSPHTAAQEAFFRWRCAAGRLAYADRHGSKHEARAILQETCELYDSYVALRDGRRVPAALPTPESTLDAASPRFVVERPPLDPFEYASRTGRGARMQAHDEDLLKNNETYRALRDCGSIAFSIVAGGSPDLDEPHPPQERPTLGPNELPPEMADFLRSQEYACLLWGTDQGTVFVVKAHARDIQSLRGNVPVQVTHELYDHPQAPVIRTLVRWYDKPESPLALESYTNIGDPQQRDDFAELAERDELRFLFYDAGLQQQLSKVVRNADRETIAQITTVADELRTRIPEEQFDFDAAKAAVMERTSL